MTVPPKLDPPATKFADSDSLSLTLSIQLAANLKAAIAARGLASLVVSGGKSPTKLFELLRAESLDWSRVCVALADERWVDPTDPGSNEKLVRDVLLKGFAAAARFIGLKNGAPTPDLGAVSAWETLPACPALSMRSCSAWAMMAIRPRCFRDRRICLVRLTRQRLLGASACGRRLLRIRV